MPVSGVCQCVMCASVWCVTKETDIHVCSFVGCCLVGISMYIGGWSFVSWGSVLSDSVRIGSNPAILELQTMLPSCVSIPLVLVVTSCAVHAMLVMCASVWCVPVCGVWCVPVSGVCQCVMCASVWCVPVCGVWCVPVSGVCQCLVCASV